MLSKKSPIKKSLVSELPSENLRYFRLAGSRSIWHTQPWMEKNKHKTLHGSLLCLSKTGSCAVISNQISFNFTSPAFLRFGTYWYNLLIRRIFTAISTTTPPSRSLISELDRGGDKEQARKQSRRYTSKTLKQFILSRFVTLLAIIGKQVWMGSESESLNGIL